MRKQNLIRLAVTAMTMLSAFFTLLTHVVDLISKAVNYAGAIRKFPSFVPERE